MQPYLFIFNQSIPGEYYTHMNGGAYFALALSFVQGSEEVLVMLYGKNPTGDLSAPFSTYELLFWSITNNTLFQNVTITTGISCARKCFLKATTSLVAIEYAGGYTAYQMSGFTCFPGVFITGVYPATNLVSATSIVRNIDIYQSTLLVAGPNEISAYGLTYDSVARTSQITFLRSQVYPFPLTGGVNLPHDIHIFSQDTYVALRAGFDSNFYLVRFSCTSCFSTGIGSSIITVDQILDSTKAASLQLLRFPMYLSKTGFKNSWAIGETFVQNCRESLCKTNLTTSSSFYSFFADCFVKTSSAITVFYKPSSETIITAFDDSFGTQFFHNYTTLNLGISCLAVSDSGIRLAFSPEMAYAYYPVRLTRMNSTCGSQGLSRNSLCFCKGVYDQSGLFCDNLGTTNGSITSVPFYVFIIAAILLVVLIVSAVCLYRYCRKPPTNRKPWVYNTVQMIRCDV